MLKRGTFREDQLWFRFECGAGLGIPPLLEPGGEDVPLPEILPGSLQRALRRRRSARLMESASR
jgi:hypothetical protein